jgi:Xaa-Pro aminopeptidase
MTITDEPGIYIPGELGIRHEDTVAVTEKGCENLTKWSGSPEEPAVV